MFALMSCSYLSDCGAGVGGGSVQSIDAALHGVDGSNSGNGESGSGSGSKDSLTCLELLHQLGVGQAPRTRKGKSRDDEDDEDDGETTREAEAEDGRK